MSTITKQWLQQKIAEMEATRDDIPFGLDEEDRNTLAAFRIALASLEAEAVAYVDPFAFHNFSVYRAGETDNKRMGREWMWSNPDAGLIPVYTAPPAPANAEPVAWLWSNRKHPSEVTLVRPEDDDKAEAAQWSGWSYQALYLAPPEPVAQDTADREMLKRLAIILSGSDAPGEIRSLTVTARSFVERCKTLAKERDDIRAALLSGKTSARDYVRREHAEWSQSTFGDVGPIGPLKHLSKEALEAASEPGDLSEWADMQFLLWDAQRRAGFTDKCYQRCKTDPPQRLKIDPGVNLLL